MAERAESGDGLAGPLCRVVRAGRLGAWELGDPVRNSILLWKSACAVLETRIVVLLLDIVWIYCKCI